MSLSKGLTSSAELLEGYTKILQFIFTDTNTGYWFKIETDGHVKKVENVVKSKEEYDVSLLFSNPTILAGLLDKSISPQAAMFEKTFKIDKGGIADLLKLGVAFA